MSGQLVTVDKRLITGYEQLAVSLRTTKESITVADSTGLDVEEVVIQLATKAQALARKNLAMGIELDDVKEKNRQLKADKKELWSAITKLQFEAAAAESRHKDHVREIERQFSAQLLELTKEVAELRSSVSLQKRAQENQSRQASKAVAALARLDKLAFTTVESDAESHTTELSSPETSDDEGEKSDVRSFLKKAATSSPEASDEDK